jgi:Zn-dependent M28 family amino/carboxypeptidase
VSGQERRLTSRNVIGAIAGSDPKLREEAILVGAHLDHLGLSGGKYYPGADDNASGVASVLEIARAFAANARKPKRTVVFAFWTGEEEGHLGSEHYVRHPRWPLARTPVYLNLDMIGHPWTKAEIEKLVADTRLPRGEEFLARVDAGRFIELGVAEWAPEVGEVLARAARGVGLALHLDRLAGTSGGSDYREFAKRGLPWVRFFGNYFDAYHEPGDTVEALDAAQVEAVARLAFASAWLLADR